MVVLVLVAPVRTATAPEGGDAAGGGERLLPPRRPRGVRLGPPHPPHLGAHLLLHQLPLRRRHCHFWLRLFCVAVATAVAALPVRMML